MKYRLYVLLLFFLFACQSKIKYPKEVFNQEKMIKVMTDVQIAESYIKLRFTRSKDSIQSADSIYAAVFRKHHINKMMYDSSFAFYSRHPELFQKVYEKVIINLSTMDAKNSVNNRKRLPAKEKKIISLPENSAVDTTTVKH